MPSAQTRRHFFLFIFFLALLLGDYFSKSYFFDHQNYFSQQNSLFGFTYYCNPNAAFGIPIAEYLVYTLFLFLFFWFIKTYIQKYKVFSALSFSPYILVIAGALGNIIDRIQYGCVVDFIDIVSWPAFNFADSYITIGVILFLYFEQQGKYKS